MKWLTVPVLQIANQNNSECWAEGERERLRVIESENRRNSVQITSHSEWYLLIQWNNPTAKVLKHQSSFVENIQQVRVSECHIWASSITLKHQLWTKHFKRFLFPPKNFASSNSWQLKLTKKKSKIAKNRKRCFQSQNLGVIDSDFEIVSLFFVPKQARKNGEWNRNIGNIAVMTTTRKREQK